MSFLTRNLRRLQYGRDFNELGEREVPPEAMRELVVNMLLHRDYFVRSPWRVFIFDDRIELISPGHLPNNLTVAHIKYGNSRIRNSVLASFGTHILPYRGVGTGIRRALKLWPDIEFENSYEQNSFTCILRRPPADAGLAPGSSSGLGFNT
jgi:ATP-dependent DNA helicase RecG